MAYEDRITVACANVHQMPWNARGDMTPYVEMIRQAARRGANLIVFPETAFTPAGAPSMDAQKITSRHDLAEPVPGPTTDRLAQAARENDMYIIAGLLERSPSDARTLYNTAVMIGPEGALIGAYRKVHLFKTEKAYATPGDELPVFETRYGPIGIAVCSDFYCYPETARTLALKGARLIALATAVMVTLRDKHGNVVIYEGAAELVPDIIRVRAYENHIYIAAANAVGASLLGYRAFGKSMIVGPHPPGSFAVRYFAGPASQVEDELIVASLDLKKMDEIRGRLWENRFPELYTALCEERERDR